MTYFTTPYLLINNPTINNGNTSTYTATGVGGVPSGALAVLMGITIQSATAGAYAQVAPNGGTMGNYFTIGNIQVANSYVNCFAIVQLDTSGKFQIKANGANVVVQTGYVFGYIL